MEEDFEIMPNLLDRRRLKDRIIENISKAVKNIQLLEPSCHDCDAQEEKVVLHNGDWQFCKLAEHLDHAFLHGLRRVTSGYWAIVQEFTHQAAVKEIKLLTKVVTDLGRSRAWLYQALSDHLLESYIRCYVDNVKLVKNFYVQDALVLDYQHLQLLMTLVSGLEQICFDLDLDVAYLDLCSHPTLPGSGSIDSQTDDDVEGDDVSVCSVSSSQSTSTNILSSLADSTAGKLFSLFRSEKDKTLPPLIIPADDMLRPDVFPSVDCLPDGDEVEVVHVRGVTKCRRRGQTRSKVNSDSSDVTSGRRSSPESGYRSNAAEGFLSTPVASSEISNDSLASVCSCPSSAVTSALMSEFCSTCTDQSGSDVPTAVRSQPAEFLTETSSIVTRTAAEDELIRSILEEHCRSLCSSAISDDTLSSSLPDEDSKCVSTSAVVLISTVDVCETGRCASAEGETQVRSSGIGLPEEENSGDSEKVVLVDETAAAACEASVVEDEISIYDDGRLAVQHCFVHETTDESEVGVSDQRQQSTCCEPVTDTDSVVSDTKMSRTSSVSSALSMESLAHSAEVRVDNNTKLVLMLEIFQQDGEKFYKMFRATVGHADGNLRPVYLLISDHALYVLSRTEKKTYKKKATVALREIDYIALSLNSQVLNIYCTRRKQFWITTGDEQLTWCVVDTVQQARTLNDESLAKLTVLTDATNQKISLTKHLAKECNLEKQDVTVLGYHLVHWEDSESLAAGTVHIVNGCKEGPLLCKVYSYSYMFGAAPTWTPAYFILRDGVLYQYDEKKDRNNSPRSSMSLSQEQCRGCRRTQHSERQHTFEILFAHRTPLELSASNAVDECSWVMAICNAVTDPNGMSYVKGTGCVACCCIMTQDRIFMCYEDVQTNVVRTLSSLSIALLNAVFVDPENESCCVLSFESSSSRPVHVTKWAIYFCAASEKDKFVSSLRDAFKQKVQKRSLQVDVLDTALAKRCRSGTAKLHHAKLKR